MGKPIIVGIDRDGTTNYDNNLFLGSKPNWKEQVEILYGVPEGIKKFNQEGFHSFIITNQSGVALAGEDFDALTENRVDEVCSHILYLLAREGAVVENYFVCPFVDKEYARKARERGRKVNEKYIDDSHPDMKPRVGMLERAARSIDKELRECIVYMIGDRASDVEMGLNAGGKGVLISSAKTIELGDVERVLKLGVQYPERTYIAKDFIDAADWIINDAKTNDCFKIGQI